MSELAEGVATGAHAGRTAVAEPGRGCTSLRIAPRITSALCRMLRSLLDLEAQKNGTREVHQPLIMHRMQCLPRTLLVVRQPDEQKSAGVCGKVREVQMASFREGAASAGQGLAARQPVLFQRDAWSAPGRRQRACPWHAVHRRQRQRGEQTLRQPVPCRTRARAACPHAARRAAWAAAARP